MIRWEEPEAADWLGYSGELVIAQVTRATGGARGRCLQKFERVARQSGWHSSGHRTTALAARRSDIARLATRS
jgi:hypothetical protein